MDASGELEIVREILAEKERELRALKARLSAPPSEEDIIDLLRKLASGDGGRRTGELLRRGLIVVLITDQGQAVLAEDPAYD